MSSAYPIDKKTKIRQLSKKGNYDRDTVHAILDAAPSAHVAFGSDSGPVVVPMIFARDGEPCDACGTRIQRAVAGSRRIYLCTTCQT